MALVYCKNAAYCKLHFCTNVCYCVARESR